MAILPGSQGRHGRVMIRLGLVIELELTAVRGKAMHSFDQKLLLTSTSLM